MTNEKIKKLQLEIAKTTEAQKKSAVKRKRAADNTGPSPKFVSTLSKRSGK